MRITAKGRVTIPLKQREALGLLPETEVEFERAGHSVRIRKVRNRSQRGRTIVARLRGRARRTSRVQRGQVNYPGRCVLRRNLQDGYGAEP